MLLWCLCISKIQINTIVQSDWWVNSANWKILMWMHFVFNEVIIFIWPFSAELYPVRCILSLFSVGRQPSREHITHRTIEYILDWVWLKSLVWVDNANFGDLSVWCSTLVHFKVLWRWDDGLDPIFPDLQQAASGVTPSGTLNGLVVLSTRNILEYVKKT